MMSKPSGPASTALTTPMLVLDDGARLEGDLSSPIGWAIELGRHTVRGLLGEAGERRWSSHAECEREFVGSVVVERSRRLAEVQPACVRACAGRGVRILAVDLGRVDVLPNFGARRAAVGDARGARGACAEEHARPPWRVGRRHT